MINCLVLKCFTNVLKKFDQLPPGEQEINLKMYIEQH